MIAVGSVRGAPGATTLTVALAAVWDRPGHEPFVLEADPDGGVLAARFGLGHHPSLTDLGVRARTTLNADDIWAVAQALPARPKATGVPVVVANPSADQCQATLRLAGTRIAAVMAELGGRDVIVDVGRLRPGSPAAPLVDASDLTLVVLRPNLDEVDAAAHRLPGLAGAGRLGLVIVGDRPYAPADVGATLGVELFGALPVDTRSAAVLSGSAARTGGLGRLPFVRSVRALALEIGRHLDAAAGPRSVEQPA